MSVHTNQIFGLHLSVILTCIFCSQHVCQSCLSRSIVCQPLSVCHVNLRPFAASMSIGHVCLYQHLFSLYPSMSVTLESQPVCLLIIRQHLSVCHTKLHFVATSMPVHVNQILNIYQPDDN